MPIFDQGFRAYEGSLSAPTGRFWTIAKAGVKLAMKKKTSWIVLLLASIPFLVLLVIIWVRDTAEQAGNTLDPGLAEAARSQLQIDGSRFWQVFFLPHALFIVPIVVLFFGSGLIANDRRTNALEIYFSRPITKRDYVIGKFAIVLTFALFVTLVDGTILYFVHASMIGTLSFLSSSINLWFRIVAASLVVTIPACAAVLAISSFAKSARFAGLVWFGLVMFTQAIGGIFEGVTGTHRYWAVSYIGNVVQCCTRILKGTPEWDYPWQISLAVLVAVTIVSFAILWRRIRPVEIVS